MVSQLCERRTSFYTGLISRKLCRFSLMFSTGSISLIVLLLFPLSITFFIFVHGFWFYFIKQMRFFRSIQLLFLSLETLTFIKRAGLPILVELVDLVNSVVIFYLKWPYSDAQMVNFPTRIPDCNSHSPALLDLFLSSNASICSTMAFLPLGNSDHVFVSVCIDFPSNSQ